MMRVGLALASFLILLALGGCFQPAPAERIVLIVVDTLRRDGLSCYGGSTPTPNIDALSEEGHIFPNAVASFHQTTMSMGAMFTGHTPSIESGQNDGTLEFNGRTWCGLARFADAKGEKGCIPLSIPTLPEFLREAGYWTIGIMSNPFMFQPAGFERGFDAWVEVGESPSGDGPRRILHFLASSESRTAEHVNAAVVQALSERAHDKIFLYVHYMDVHDYPFAGMSYSEAVAKMDRAVGELLQKLKEEDLYAGTVILFISDHGERFGEQHLVDGLPGHFGNPSFEEVLRVPLIISPRRFDDVSRLVRSQDVFQLIAGMAGVRPRVPRVLEPGELFLTEGSWRTYRKGRWKSFIRREDGRVFLVDLTEDPAERRDVADQNPSVVKEHRERTTILAQQLAARDAPASELSPEDRARLRSLGYLE